MSDPRRDATGAHEFVQVPELPMRSADPHVAQGRLVAALVLAVVVSIGAFIAAMGLYFFDNLIPREPIPVPVGPFEPLISPELPPLQLVVAACLAMVGIAAVAVGLEMVAALLTINPRRNLLSAYRPQISPAEDGTVRITVLVPAHNEEAALPVTLSALANQTRQPDRVVVVADNCTDRTVEIAREMGHEAFETVDNSHRKGGALNQALSRMLPEMGGHDVVMVMDADTSLDPQFLEVAARAMERDPELTAVGGIFYGEDGYGLIGQLQRNEYTRYSMQIKARHGRVFVLTGTASVFRAEALMDVAAARGVFIPGEPGNVYDTAALTEDNELTLALKSLGATMKSPQECRVTTEIMPTWRNLWVQRQRWQRGALENLAAYGFTRGTARYWGQQFGIGYGVIALNLALLLMLITVLAEDNWIWFPFWAGVGIIFVAERTITVWKGGWRARLLAALLFPELLYDVFLQTVFVKCLFDIAVARQPSWGHVSRVESSA